jgi:hypothetical protein
MAKKKVTNRTDAQKIKIMENLFTFDEVLEILGWYDDSNESICTPEMADLEENNYPEFYKKIMAEAIINGNFEESIEYNDRLRP